MVLHKAVHDLGRTAAAVEDVAHQVQVVDGKALDERGERADKGLGRVGLENRVDDALVVAHAIVVLVGVRMQELVDDIGVVVRDGLAHLGARVAARESACHGDEPIEHGAIPGGGVEHLLVGELDLLVRVVDEGAELALLVFVEFGCKDLVHVLANHARAVVEDMHERLVLTMQVAHKMLSSLGEIEDRLQIDDLGEDGLLVGELPGEQLEVLEVLNVQVGVNHRIVPFRVASGAKIRCVPV